MRQLVGLVLAISLTITLGIGIALQVGQWQPIPAWITTLHLGECTLPCWIQIAPGKTSGNRTFVDIDAVFLTTLQQSVAPTLERGLAMAVSGCRFLIRIIQGLMSALDSPSSTVHHES